MKASLQADRMSNRAPRGGAISRANGRFYKGGQWMPMIDSVVEVKPTPLAGSWRQVAWATRLRRQEMTRLEEELFTRRLMLSDPKAVALPLVREAIRRDSIALHALMSERSAAAIIDRRCLAW